MYFELHITPHWAGEVSPTEWTMVIAAVAIGTLFAIGHTFRKPVINNSQIVYDNKNLRRLSLIYSLIALGVALEIGGGKWDVTWHGLQKPETFFTPPHTVLYAGVALVLSMAIIGLYLKFRSKNFRSQNKLLDPLNLAIAGSIMQIFSGGFDFTWHSTFGFDGLLSPPHTLLVSGMILNSLAAVKGLTMTNQMRNYEFKKVTKLAFALGFTVFWMSSVAMLDLYTYPWSKGEHFDFNPDPQLAALTGTVLFPLYAPFVSIIALRTLPTRYPVTLVTGLYIIIITLANIVPDESLHSSLPYYTSNVLVALAIDFIYKAKFHNKAKVIAIGALLGPFFLTMYFPGVILVYHEPLQLPDNIPLETLAFLPLLYQTQIGIVLIPSILAGIAGAMLGSRAAKMWLEPRSLRQKTAFSP